MNKETREFICKNTSNIRYKDYTKIVDANIKSLLPIEICTIDGQDVYPFRDLEERSAGYINEEGKIEGNLNTLFGLSNISFLGSLRGNNLIITKTFRDTLFLLKNNFDAAGVIDNDLSDEQYNILSRLAGFDTITILLNPSLENKILIFKLIKRLYPLFNIKVCRLSKNIQGYSEEELKNLIDNSQEVTREHFLNVEKYIETIEYRIQELKIEIPNFEEY